MNKMIFILTVALITLLIVSTVPTVADDFDIDWYTIDGGGEMWCAGDDFELGGTIGQYEAGVMSGSNFELTGGFWAVPSCWCLADVNNDGKRNSEDIQIFVDCLLAAGFSCACADVETDGILDMNDVILFVHGLLSGTQCP